MKKERSENTKEVENKNKSHIALVILLILLLLVGILFLLFSCNKDDSEDGNNNDNDYGDIIKDEDNSYIEYRNALKYIANNEYKEDNSITDEKDYISHISSLCFDPDSYEFKYGAYTNLSSGNSLLIISIEFASTDDAVSALEYIKTNYKTITISNVEYYEEYLTSNTALDSYIKTYTSNPSTIRVDKGIALNPDIVTLSISYKDSDGFLTSTIADYSISEGKFDDNVTITTSIPLTNTAITGIVEF